MNKPDLSLNEAIAKSLGALARAEQEQISTDDAAREHLLLRVQEEERARSRQKRWWAAVPAIGLACTLVVWRMIPSQLTFEVVGASAGGPYVNASADHKVSLHFSDSSLVDIEQGSQIRVEETRRHGARVLLERGTAEVRINHRERADWTFVAGPCEVKVTGTRFDMSWDPALEVFELRLQEGSVEIRTPLSPGPVALRAGQQFHADVGNHRMTATEPAVKDEQLVHAPSAPAVSEEANPPAPAPGAGSSPRRVGARPVPMVHGWPKLVAAGEFATVLAQANARGIARCLERCSVGDLSALADAARYSGSSDVAALALRALRSRFSGDPAGHAAAFLLGRLLEGQGDASEALTWYERYLSETPGGSYAAEALGGKMETTLTTSGPAAARPIADEYLQRYPAGVHARTARGISGAR